MADGGHTFVKKAFHKPTYCHHCSDLLWGLIGQSYICEVCNFIIHERCVSSVVTPCSGIAPCIIKNPVAHCWSEPIHHKRKFCTVCRKRLDETPAVHCLICEYFAHVECQDFAVPDCTENATYVPGKELQNVKHQHHWREGNLPQTSKCAYCKKTCFSSECLTGYRCEWCGMTTHGGCRMYLPAECNFGILQPIYLPPHAVSIPRTEVPIEAIIGVQVKSKTTLVRDYSCPELSRLESAATPISDDPQAPARSASGRGESTPEISLRKILIMERQRRKKMKHDFFLSSPPTPTSLSSLSLSPTASLILHPTIKISPLVGSVTGPTDQSVSNAEVEQHVDASATATAATLGKECAHPLARSSTTIAKQAPYIVGIQKSPSASSSLQQIYGGLLRRLQHGEHTRRKHLSSNTDDTDDIDVDIDIDNDNDNADDYEDDDEDDASASASARLRTRTGASASTSAAVCDISGGDLSDEYDHCDVELRKKGLGGRVAAPHQRHTISSGGSGGDFSDIEYVGKEVPAESCYRCYETSDTGGELTTTDDIDIDSSMNLLSNLSYNSHSNSNTSIENRSHIAIDRCMNAQCRQPTAMPSKTVQTKPKASKPGRSARAPHELNQLKPGKPLKPLMLMLTAKATGGKFSKGGSASSPNSSECSSVSPVVAPMQLQPVGRSQSLQEAGVKQTQTQTHAHAQKHKPKDKAKKYTRIFQRRRSQRSKLATATAAAPAKVTASQPIAITIQDEDGNYQPYDDEFCTISCDRLSGATTSMASARAASATEVRSRHGHVTRSDIEDDNEYDSNENDADADGDADADADAGAYSDGHDVCFLESGDPPESPNAIANETDNQNARLFGRWLKRMRRISLGWRKPRYQKRRARSISEEFSSGDTPRFKDEESMGKTESVHGGSAAGCSSGGSSHYRPDGSSHKSDKVDKDREKKDREREEKDIEMIKVFDGNNSFRRQLYRVIIVPRTYTLEQLLTTALRAFHITRDPSAFYMTDLYAPAGMEDTPLQDPNPVLSLVHVEGKRPAIYLRFHDKDKGFVRVYPGKLQCSLEEPYVSVPVDNSTVIKDLIRDALDKFGLHDNQIQDYRCSEVLLDRGVTERILSWNERPWDIMKQLGKDSIRQMELMRFYMQHKQDPHGPNIALFVGNLPPGLSQRNYEQILNKYVTDENKFTSIGPIYYEYGSVVLTYEDSQKAVRAFYNLRETIIEDKKLLVMLLPNIDPSMIPPDVRPLLVFVNVKSGGCQGLELISSFRKLLNPYQVFDLDNGGPLPGLYVFRQIANYKILVCGGDGTIGWVLQCLDNVGQDSECSSPPCAIVPLGTGNDLARVLCWGSGYTGGEDPLNLLRDVIEAEEIRLDRWTVVFHPEDKPEEPALKAPSNTTGGGAQNEDNSQIFVMNNYFGIGIDADLCLDFHNAREENPNKFNSRFHNKGYYVKMGLRKIVGRKTVKDLHKELRLEVDGKVVELPPVEGIIILNILSWGSGANPWGPDKDDNFTTPNHYDGVLEIVGVTGVVHLGQIQSGIRTATRIAQGGHIKIHLYSDMPVQVDGEPWVQSPGDVVVLKSALKATMLKKNKSKMKRRNTEPTMVVTGSLAPQMTLTLPPTTAETEAENTENSTNNTDF